MQIPFNALLVGIDGLQALYFILDSIMLMIPFFLGALIIVLFLMKHPAGMIYFSNLAGSGLGVLGCYVLMHYIHPFSIIYLILGVLSLSLLLSASLFGKKTFMASIAFLFLIIFCTGICIEKLGLIRISEYKSYSLVKNMPDFSILAEKFSPQSLITLARADGLRKPGDLSYSYTGTIPEAAGMFYDYDNPSAVYRWNSRDSDLQSFDFLLSSPAGMPHYILKDSARTSSLVIGTGGGSALLRSLLTGFKNIAGIEYNKTIIRLMENELRDYTGNIYKHENIRIIDTDARSFIQTSQEPFQLIELEMLNSFISGASGIASMKEDYLYTRESFALMYGMLSTNGILSVSRWLREPPRDSLKIINTVYEALVSTGIDEPGMHIISARGPLSINILIFKQQVKGESIEKALEFCSINGFDAVYYPGMGHHKQETYFMKTGTDIGTCIKYLLDNQKRESFIKNYLFYISPATDNKPYFGNFFRYPVINEVIRKSGTRDLEFSQWGYFSLFIMLAPTLALSLIFIFSPLLLSRERLKPDRHNLYMLLFFFCLGIAFFFVEIVLIQKLILFLGHPISSISLVLASIMCFSGLGSYFSNRLHTNGMPGIPLGFIIAFIVLTNIMIDFLLPLFQGHPYTIRAVLSVISLLPLSFFMGMPFPITIEYIKRESPDILPWCWGANGFASVNSIFICAILSLTLGFRAVVISAMTAYGCAFGLIFLIKRNK